MTGSGLPKARFISGETRFPECLCQNVERYENYIFEPMMPAETKKYLPVRSRFMKKVLRGTLLLLVSGLAYLPGSAFAEVADRVVAVVGHEAIYKS